MLKKAGNIVEKEYNEKIYIINIDNENSYVVEDVAKLIWENMFNTSVENMCSRIAKEYEVDFDIAKEDVNELIEDFINNNLIEVV